jgi:hypothetical protein
MAGAREPLDALTDDDYGAVVRIVGTILASVAVVAAVVRFWYARHRRMSFGWDDGTYIVANVGFPSFFMVLVWFC